MTESKPSVGKTANIEVKKLYATSESKAPLGEPTSPPSGRHTRHSRRPRAAKRERQQADEEHEVIPERKPVPEAVMHRNENDQQDDAENRRCPRVALGDPGRDEAAAHA